MNIRHSKNIPTALQLEAIHYTADEHFDYSLLIDRIVFKNFVQMIEQQNYIIIMAILIQSLVFNPDYIEKRMINSDSFKEKNRLISVGYGIGVPEY